MKNPNQEDEFYQEMDKKTLKNSCCSCQTMAIFFGIVLAIASIGVIYLFYQIKADFSFKSLPTSLEEKNKFSAKINLNPQLSPSFELVITSEELTASVQEGFSLNNLAVKDIQMVVHEKGVDAFGALVRPLNAKIYLLFQPKADQGQINFEVKKIKAGNLALPQFLSSQFDKPINELLARNFAPLYKNYQVENIELFDDKMIIRGKLK